MSTYTRVETSQRRPSSSGNPVRRRSSAFIGPPVSAIQEAIGGEAIESALRNVPDYDEIDSSDNDNVSEGGDAEFVATDEHYRGREGLFHTDHQNPLSFQVSPARRRSSSSVRPVSLGDYCRVLQRYPMYRAYLLSHICQNLGDWFVRIASILIVEELAASGETGKSLSHMTLARLLPNAVFAQVGGVLADQFDRRNLMIATDVVTGFVVLGFLVAIQYQTLPMFYVITSLRSALGAIYFPVTTSMVPLLVPEPRDMQLAATMNSWAWGATSIVGGLVAGSLTAAIGLTACYVIDFITFLLSAVVIAVGVKGNFKVNNGTGIVRNEQPSATQVNAVATSDGCLQNGYQVIRDLAVYLWTCGFGTMVFLKSSASFVWGIEDIVGAEFCTVFRDDGTEDEKTSSMHMGMLFSVIGLGCMTGPALVNLITDAHRPYTLQRGCLIGLLFLTCGWLAISMVVTYPQFLAASFFRTMGSGTVWVHSTLVLQTLTDKEILGRVLAVEYTMFTLFEAASSTVTGSLDDAGFSKNSLALFGFSLGVFMLTVWGTYYYFSLGAAQPRFNNNYRFDPLTAKEAGDIELEEAPSKEWPKGSKSERTLVFV